MQAPGDNSITVVDPHVETYADNNLNEKNLGTQYIYTTEGQLIPATEDHNTSNMDLNSPHYNTIHVTEAQSIHIQQVDYQYEQQYPEGTVQQVVPVSGTEFVQDQSNTYMLDQASYVPDAPQEVSASIQQVYSSEVETEQTSTNYEYTATAEVGENNIAGKTVVSEGQEVTSEPATSGSTQQTNSQVAENENKVDQVKEISESFTTTSEIIKPVEPSGKPVLEKKSMNQLSENDNEIENVEMKEEQSVTTDEAVTAAEEDQTSLEDLKTNPAIEIEDDDSVDAAEEQESESVQEIKPVVAVEKAKQEVSTVELKEVEKETTTVETRSQEADSSEIAAKTEVSNSKAPAEAANQTPRPRGRKPKTDIPLHILGHDVNNPMEKFVNGKTPKPRLGVKVPYRNLTSQIVSKADIENEIMERGRKKEEGKREISFARQLTSRLAKKIAPESADKSESSNSKPSKRKDKDNAEISADNQMEVDNNGNQETSNDKSKDAIDNNSDLLAILEGDGDAEEMPQVSTDVQNKQSTPTDETNLKNLEREIALQQLQDLPYLSPKTRFVKGNKLKVYTKELAKEKEVKTGSLSKSQTPKSPIKSSMMKLEVEPQIKVNMTLKTYSRKRKSTEGVVESTPSPSKKTNVVVSAEEIDIKPYMEPPASEPVYVTKSSRIIKKKVIWDPDESPSRSKPSPVKPDTHAQPKVIHKTVQPKSEIKSTDLPKKSAVEVKVVKIERKVEEKHSPKKIVNAEKRTSPGASKLAIKPKKPKTEVDRLLGDEGAIKMLYDLKNSENAIEEKRKKTVFSVEKTFKELAKRANQIKSDLVNTSTAETPKNLRKKEPMLSPMSTPKPPPSLPVAVSTPVVPGGISRQKSKDSSRSTPPPSPAFSFPNEVSYLIRRRSSSSISSKDDTGESMDLDDSEERLSKKKPISTSSDPLKVKKSKKNSESEKSHKRAENRIGHYKTFGVKKANRSVTIDLHTGISTGCYFTSELLSELTTALNKISKEKDCHVVLIKSSKDSVFSHGLNYKHLVSDKESTRKNKANELADQVRNFIQCLMDFPKILIAGIQGECAGLAVTMLPLFDFVIASDDARFSTSYSALGCVAEAGFLLAVPHVSSYGLAGELLYAAQILTADEACRRGLISKLCWPEKYQDTLKTMLAAVAQGSKQCLEATKKQLRSVVRQNSQEALESMVAELVEHWTSNECQISFAKIE